MIKEAESSLKIPVTFCSMHQERAVLSVCLDETCQYRGMFCYQCIKFHYAHLDRTFEIKEFLNSVSEHINELSFDMLPTESSPPIKELYRQKYEQVVQNKENLLKEKELIIEAIGKFVQLTMESAEKKLEDIDTKNPASQKTQTMQELTSYQEKFFDLANLQPEELYDMLVFFSRFITKTSDDKIEIIKGAPGKNPSASSLPKQVALAVEGDLDSTCQTLKNSQLILQKLAGILERLPPDDKAHSKLNNIKPQHPSSISQQQQQLAQAQFAKKRQIQSQPSPFQNQERTFTHKSINLNGHYHQQQQQQQQQQRSQIHGFENNNNLFEQVNSNNGNSIIINGTNNHANHPRRQFNQSQVLASLPSFDKSSVSYKNNSRDTTITTAPVQAAPAPSFLQQFQQKLNENNMNKQALNNSMPSSQGTIKINNTNNKPMEGGEQLGSFNSSEETNKGQKRLDDKDEKLAFQKDLEKKRNAPKIEVTSSQRLSLRSIEHFCDALEVNYNDTWCISFKVNEECNLSGIYHFPIFVYESSVGDSLPSCELELSIFEGNNGSFKNPIFQQALFLTKTNCNLSSSTTSCLDEQSDSKETLLKVLEKVNLNVPLALTPNMAYTIVLRNKTREQQDMSKQLYILFGDDSSQGKQPFSVGDKTNGNKFVQFQQTDTQQFQQAYANSKLIVSNNDSLEDPQLSDYFVPFLALTHQSNMTPLKNINGEQNRQVQVVAKQSIISSSKKQKTPNTIQESQSLFQTSQFQPQGFKDLINNYKPIGNGGNSFATSTYSGNNNNNENDFTKYNSRIGSSGNQVNTSTTSSFPSSNNQSNANSSSNNNKRKYQNAYPQVQNFTVPPQYGYNSSNNNTNNSNSQIYSNNTSNGSSNNYYHQNQATSITSFPSGNGLNSNFDKNGLGQEFATQKKLKR